MKTDEAFRTKIMAVSDVGERIKLINAEGFACGTEEIQAQGKVLEDCELDIVAAAGTSCSGACIPLSDIHTPK